LKTTKQQQIFELREQKQRIWIGWMAEAEVNVRDLNAEVEMEQLQAKINQLLADENLESSSN
jgi:hypothetical protein